MTDYFSYTLDADAIRAISSIGLAHLGDAVYELLVRTYLCAHGKATGKGLHRATVELVRAPKQAELYGTVDKVGYQKEIEQGLCGITQRKHANA